MSGQLKLSKIFYINPTSLPIPKPVLHPSGHSDCPLHILKENILRDGFHPKYPIIVCMGEDDIKSKWEVDIRPTYIVDGNHRLAVAQELKLNYIPVRFLENLWLKFRFSWNSTLNKYMSNKVKLSKIFYVNPKSLPSPFLYIPPTLHTTYSQSRLDKLKENILRNGFDDKHPILIDLDSDWKGTVGDGNHRLTIALQLKLNYVPVRFEYKN